jgi:hypothetical protein
MTFHSRGDIIDVWADGERLQIENRDYHEDGTVETVVTLTSPKKQPPRIAVMLEHEYGYYGGAAFPLPVKCTCVEGEAPLGDWADIGLADYSGMMSYRTTFALDTKPEDGVFRIRFGDVTATAEVKVNGESAGILIAPPWETDITGMVTEGENTVEVTVANTLANHYDKGIPTRYVFEGQTRAGLFGPVTVDYYPKVVFEK